MRILYLATNEGAKAVAEGDADFGIAAIPALEATTQFEPLLEERIVVALPTDHALADLQDIGWTSLKALALILPARDTGHRLLIDEAMARARQQNTWSFEAGRTTTSLEMVLALL